MRTRLLSIALLSAAALSTRAQTPAVEQPTPTPAPAPMSPAVSPTEGHKPTDTKATVARGKDTLSVDFPDEEIRTVLRNVADLFELNLVIPDTLQGKTSIKLRDVTWRQIFKVVLEPVGYTFIEDGNIIKVVTADSLNLEPVTTEVFVLNYARASDIKPSIDGMVDPKLGGKIMVDARSNALVLTERPSAIQRIRPIILNLDKATEQVMIETKFIEVTDGDTKDIGVNWSSLKNYKVGTKLPIEQAYTDTRTRKTSDGVGEANIDDLHSQQLLDRGWLFPKPVVDPVTKEVTYPDAKANDSHQLDFVRNLSQVTSTVFSADQFSLVLSALQSTNNTKLVSNPTVVTLNNTEATINIGEEFPIPNYTYNQERGNFEVSGFAYKPIGVLLKVTPQVNSAGFIKLTVAPEVTNRTTTVNFGGAGGAVIPIIGVRKTTTQITLKDGYTLGIGGLVESSANKGQTKVPILGSIPGLGRLFRSDSRDSTVRNLIVFITAHTIKPDGATVGEVFDPRMIRDMKITKDELPGFRDGSDPFYQPPAEPLKK